MTAPVLAEIPVGPVPVPPQVGALAGDDLITPVWRNELGGLTFRLDPPDTSGAHARFVKWSPTSAGLDLRHEAERLAWAAPWTPVPRVLDAGEDEAGQWLVTAALEASSAVVPRWQARPETAAWAIGAGLRALHDALPVAHCPFTWSVEERVARAEARFAAGEGPETWAAEHLHLTVAEARARLADVPDLTGPVVCHGDACAPNTLLAEDGSWAAHVDLGRLGVADPWADLAVATWSTEWNYGSGYDHLVYEAYGVEPDPERIAWYRLLWDLS